MKRLLYLDNLKVCLTVLVIFHHAGQAYGDGGGWAYTPSNPAEVMPWIWHFFSVNAAFFMGLFFLISGYFVPASYDKQGASIFVQKKLIRLGIPLLVMGGLLSVLSGKFEIGHMWHWIWPFGIIPLPMEPAHYLQYVMMFVVGILASRIRWLERISKATGFLSLVIGCLLALGIYLRDGGEWNDFVAQWFGIYESLLCVFISFGLLWLFREYGNWNSKFWQWCAAQAYGAYIVHLLLMIALQYAVDGIWMGAFGKFMFTGVVTTIASFGLTWLLRMILSIKKVL